MDLANIKIPRRLLSVRIIAVFLVIIACVFLWFSLSKKVPAIEAEITDYMNKNQSLSSTEKELSNLYQSMDFYMQETENLNKKTEEILTEFPTFMYLEDKLLYAHILLNGSLDGSTKGDLSGYNISDFSYGESAYVMNVKYGATEEQMLELYSVSMSSKYLDITYKQIKEILDYGLNSSQRFVMTNLTMAYNEKTGYISGEFSFKTYFIPGQAEPYEFPQSVVDDLGDTNRVDNLFDARTTPTSVTPGYTNPGEEEEVEEPENPNRPEQVLGIDEITGESEEVDETVENTDSETTDDAA